MWEAIPESSRTTNFAGALSHYGGLLVDLGKPREAEPVLRRALGRYEAQDGAGGYRGEATRARLAASLAGQGRWEDAASLLASALPALEGSPYDWDDRQYVRWQLLRVRALLELGGDAEAAAALAELRQRLTAERAAEWPEVAAELAALATRLPAAG